jgi:serine/threonine protein kinase
MSRKMIQRDEYYELIRNEIEIMMHTDHRHCLKMFGYFSDEFNIYLILEYANGGDLFSLMQNQVLNRID